MNNLNDIQDEKLEDNLLDITAELLKNQQLRYNDDIIKTLSNIYCIKKIEGKKVEETTFSMKNLARGFLSPFTKGKGSSRYRGIDGNIYYREDLLVWSQVKPLLLKLREKIQNNQFRVNW
ncbi:MAG: hypothetical protein ACOCQH_02530 [Halanaerobiales bacterium]